MILNALPTYPTARSYVLKLHRDAAPGLGNISGRIENVSTGEVYEFASGWELLACLARDAVTQGMSPNHRGEI